MEHPIADFARPARSADRFIGVEPRTPSLNLRVPDRDDLDAILAIHADSRACEHNPSHALTTRAEAEDLLVVVGFSGMWSDSRERTARGRPARPFALAPAYSDD